MSFAKCLYLSSDRKRTRLSAGYDRPESLSHLTRLYTGDLASKMGMTAVVLVLLLTGRAPAALGEEPNTVSEMRATLDRSP